MKEYMIVKGSEQAFNVFERRVNSFIIDGWEPLGSVTCVHITNPSTLAIGSDILYRQAMVRRVE